MTPSPELTRPLFERITDQPLMSPRPGLDWEKGGVFAPAVIKDNQGYHMIYRAFGADRISRLGLATSKDGLVWERLPEPILTPADEQEAWGIEDPRLVRIDGLWLLAFTAASGHQEKDGWHWTTRIRFASSRDGRNFVRINPRLPEVDNKDAALFPRKINGKYWLMHRFMPDIWVSSSSDLTVWHDHRRIVEPVPGTWQSLRIGAGAPPIETPLGWLMFHHGVSSDLTYCMSAFILDRDDPTQVLYRLPYPLLVPGEMYELRGVVNKVVFGTGVTDEGDKYRLYYGAADDDIAAAEINKAALLAALQDYPAGSAPPRAVPEAKAHH